MAENYDLIFGQSASQQYGWSDSDYQNGWQTVGSTPPTAEQFDALQRRSDTKAKDLNDRLSPLETKAEADGRQAATSYTSGAMLTVDGLPNGWLLECIAPGISGTDAITLPDTLIDGLTIIDGNVTWALRKVATNGGLGYRQPSTAYAVGDIAYSPSLPTGYCLGCTTAGTTADTMLDCSANKLGDTVTDGTVVWTVEQTQLITTASKALADLTPAVDKVPYFNSQNTAALTDITDAGRAVLAKSSADELLQYVVPNNAGAHNAIYRGKNLGSSVAAAQYAAISTGTFDDLFIGDYWTIGDVNWRIAAFDYWLYCAECTTHHVVIVPDTSLANAQMNSTNVTDGGYAGSDFYTGSNSNTGKATAVSRINAAFGSSHILTHREYLTNAVTDGKPTGGGWYDSTVELMSEAMVYGAHFFEPNPNGQEPWLKCRNYTFDKTQLPLFAHDPSRITNRDNWWLRGVVSATAFADVHEHGWCDHNSASHSLRVRPAFGIK